jgi:macrodomain Ter protein organizer (MatP/YcbG family)
MFDIRQRCRAQRLDSALDCKARARQACPPLHDRDKSARLTYSVWSSRAGASSRLTMTLLAARTVDLEVVPSSSLRTKIQVLQETGVDRFGACVG